MALVLSGFEVTVELKDSSNRSFRKVLKCNSGVADHAAALTAAAAYAAALSPIIDTVIKSYRVSDIFEENAFALPTGGINGSEQAMLVWNLEGGLETVNHFLPGPDPGIFVATSGPNRNVIDIADAALGTYQNQFKTTGGVFEVSDGEQIDDDTPILRGERITKAYNPR